MEKEEKKNSGRDNGEIEIDLGEVFYQLGKHIWTIILSALLCAGITFTVCNFLITPQYESTSILYVLSKSTSITSLADVQMGASLTTDYKMVVSGRPVLETVIDNLKLNESYGELKNSVTITNPSDTRFIEISVRDPDVKRAKKITDEIADVAADYISKKMDQDPPTIIQKGYTDGGPVSPNTGRNTIAGALIGLLAACVVIIVSWILNDTIMTPDDVEKRLGLKTLGTIPADDDINDELKPGARRKVRARNA